MYFWHFTFILYYMCISDKKGEKVYTSARKQMLISALPPVVTLHLKRFHQVWISVSKQLRLPAHYFSFKHWAVNYKAFYCSILKVKFHWLYDYCCLWNNLLVTELPTEIYNHGEQGSMFCASHIDWSVFSQAGMNLRKVNRHVDFPLILDLAPFCSATCKVQITVINISHFDFRFHTILPCYRFRFHAEFWIGGACALQLVWHCGTQRIDARGALRCICEGPHPCT